MLRQVPATPKCGYRCTPLPHSISVHIHVHTKSAYSQTCMCRRCGTVSPAAHSQHCDVVQGCTFTDNSPDSFPVLLADNREVADSKGVFYSDPQLSGVQVCGYEGPDQYSRAPPCTMSDPLALQEAGTQFLNASSPWFVNVQQVSPSVMLVTGEPHDSQVLFAVCLPTREGSPK